MRRVVFLVAVLAPAAALIAVLWNDATRGFGPRTPSVAQRVAPTTGLGSPASRRSAVSMAEGSGTDLFLRRDDVVTIGGAAVTYPRVYAFAKSWRHAESGVVAASEPILVFNARPRNEHDLARILQLVVDGGSSAAGASLLQAFGAHRGIRATAARIHGSDDLSVIDRIDLFGGVEAVFVDPEVPGDQAVLVTEAATLDFKDQKLAAIRSDAHFTLARPLARDLDFAGRGFEALFESGVVKIFHDISLSFIPPERFGRGRDPITLQTPGPVEIALAHGSSAPELSLAGARVVAAGGVSCSQGGLSGSGQEAIATFDAASRLETLEIRGDARVASAEGDARGSRLLLRPLDPSEFARLEGSPVTVAFADEASFLPARWGRGVVLTTHGTIAVSPEDAATRERTVTIGPGVNVTGSLGRLDAARAVTTIGIPGDDRIRPFRVALENVIARDLETDLDAAILSITRARGKDGVDDVITFPGRYDIATRPKSKAAGVGPPAPRPPVNAAAGAIPAFGGSPMRIVGDGGLTITRPVADARPISAVALEKFRIEALEEGTGKIRGALEARRGNLVAVATPGVREPGAPPTREIESFVADGRVRIDVPGRALARGDTLTYDARRRDVVLVGSGADEPARIERGVEPAVDWLNAGAITFQIDLLRLVATKGVAAKVAMQPLPWIGVARSKETVPTHMTAQRMVAHLDAARYANGEIAVSEIAAEIAVNVGQPGRKLTADFVQFDQVFRTGVVRGQPLRYEVVRDADGAALEEGLVCPSFVVDGRRLLVEGPANTKLHTKPGSAGILPDLGEAAKATGTRPAASSAPTPVHIRCGGPTLVSEEFLRADINVVIEQGDLERGGMLASADSATLFMQKAADAPKGDPDFGLAVLHGHARFKSADFDASSDVMKLNRVRKLITLVNERPEKLVVVIDRDVIGSEARNGMARLDVDYSRPGKPAITAFDHDVVLMPDTRSARP